MCERTLKHPNIVSALDAGETTAPHPTLPALAYLVMEYISGQDLEAHVRTHGPMGQALACNLGYQIASALSEVQRHNLVHRDVKPSNILLTPEGQAKLLDFGLTRQFGRRVTQPGTVLGTLEYMAPEQLRDASRVDIRSDLYGLGGTLFWCLTGRVPFEPTDSLARQLSQRLSQTPPSMRVWRPEIPAELDAVVARLLAPDPDNRYPTPLAAMQSLHLFLKTEGRDSPLLSAGPTTVNNGFDVLDQSARLPDEQRVLIVDDEPHIRKLCRLVLKPEGLQCDDVANGGLALAAIRQKRYDLVILDIDMPEMTGIEVLRQLRDSPPCPHLKIIMASGRVMADEMAEMLSAGADDYLSKPLATVQLRASRPHYA